MPLIKGYFDENKCKKFVAAKESLWMEHGYGPWAFIIDGVFAGWGGVQPENGTADLALVLHPDFWGMGRMLYQKIIHFAFNELQLPSVTILFPPTRTRVQGLLKLGFQEEDIVKIDNVSFVRFCLYR